MRLVFVAALVAACSGNGKTTTTPHGGDGSAGSATPPPPPVDNRSEIQKRRDVACEALQPVLLDCAIASAKANLTPEEYRNLNPDQLRAQHKKEFLADCKGKELSSRQVRVLEVCFREEKECGPLADCLAYLNAQKPAP
ncbi:MAG: hypothetical protein KIT31_18545 [Deltaproteobacteria bacterium]|nr:hypothetical protein [Deltaproteobacteria bacterium]